MKGVNREKSGFLVSGLANKSVDARLNLKEEPLNGLDLPLKGKKWASRRELAHEGPQKGRFQRKKPVFLPAKPEKR